MNLPHISGANPKKIAEFSKKLNYSVQALETLKRLKDVQGCIHDIGQTSGYTG